MENSLFRMLFIILLFCFWGGTAPLFGQNTNLQPALLESAKAARNSGNYARALRLYDEASKLKQENLNRSIFAEIESLLLLIDLGNYAEADRRHAEIAENSALRGSPDNHLFWESYQGWRAFNSGHYQRADSIFSEVNGISGTVKDKVVLGRYYTYYSATFWALNELQSALFFIKRAISEFEAASDGYWLSFSHNVAHLIYADLGKQDNARLHISKSIQYAEALENPDLLDTSYHNYGLFMRGQGAYDKAISLLQQSLENARIINNPGSISVTLENIGYTYSLIRNNEKALIFYNDALEIAETRENLSKILGLNRSIANTHLNNGNMVQARHYFEKVEPLIDRLDSPQERAYFYTDHALFYSRNKNFIAAERSLNKALEISHRYKLDKSEIDVLVQLGILERNRKNYIKSVSYLEQAFNIAGRRPPMERLWPAVEVAVSYKFIDADSAVKKGYEAVKLLESIREKTAPHQLKANLFSKYSWFYGSLALWILQNEQNIQKAHKLVETGKSRLLIEELVLAREFNAATIPEEAALEKRRLQQSLDSLYLLSSKGEPLESKIANKELEYEAFLEKWHSGSALSNISRKAEPISIPQLQKQLDPETALIQFAVAGDSVMQFVITKKEARFRIISSVLADGNHLNTMISEFRDAIQTSKPLQELNHISKKLYDHIWPGEFIPADIRNILMIPEAAFVYLPFEALHSGSGFLIEKYVFKNLPSASIISYIKNPHRNPKTKVLAIAGANLNSAEGNSVRSGFGSLPATLLEMDYLTGSFSDMDKIADEAEPEKAIKSTSLEGYSIVHFATHGDIDEENPQQSKLILSDSESLAGISSEDGFLKVMEISNLNFNADLIVLSACNTAMGKYVSGEGLLGMERAFLTAGASSVMSSLWSVYDRSTAEFMNIFYKSLNEFKQNDYGSWSRILNYFGLYEHPLMDYKARALQKTKQQMLSHPYYNHPVHWAAFVLTGK